MPAGVFQWGGAGLLDYGTFISELIRLHPDLRFALENLAWAAEYALAGR